MTRSDAELSGVLQYRTDLFDRSTIQRMSRHLATLLEGAARDPALPIRDLPLMAGDERADLVVKWNETTAPAPPHTCVHQLFERQVRTTPHAIAVECGGLALSYAQIDASANRLAHCLIGDHGVGPEVLVPICAARGIDMIVGLLAILKAGGAYVPLDPELPSGRLSAILHETRSPVVLTEPAMADKFQGCGRSVILLDRPPRHSDRHQGAAPASLAAPGNLVYCIYTSGSTGEPKGVAVAHRQLVNYVLGFVSRAGIDGRKRYLYMSPLFADLGNTTLFASLLTGGTLVLASDSEALDPDAAVSLVQQGPVDILKLTPSHFSALWTNCSDPVALLPAELMIFGGERLPSSTIRSLLAAGGTKLLNHYGPTETTIGAAMCALDRRSLAGPYAPIGTPLPHVRLYILDRDLNPVPIGVQGMIHIGGEGVARGYLGKPGMTAERFLPDPFTSDGGRMYRTGDLGRIRSDGRLEFLGRSDDQVKVHGFRVELGEIEAAIVDAAHVEHAAVIASEADEQVLLVAYIGARGLDLDIDRLATRLRKSLPARLVPSQWILLEALPLNANGKVDKRALQAYRRPGFTLPGKAVVMPRNRTEEQVADIWSVVLRQRQFGVHDDFFELGGTSLLAIQVHVELRRRLGFRTGVRSLFALRTIATIAESIDSALIHQ